MTIHNKIIATIHVDFELLVLTHDLRTLYFGLIFSTFPFDIESQSTSEILTKIWNYHTQGD